MKALIATLFIAGATFAPLHAAMNEHDAHAGHGTMTSSADGSFVDGVVKKIDKAAGKITVSHGPLTNLNMPAMTMVFRVKDAAWLDQMQAGAKIRFVADSINGALTIVELEPAK